MLGFRGEMTLQDEINLQFKFWFSKMRVRETLQVLNLAGITPCRYSMKLLISIFSEKNYFAYGVVDLNLPRLDPARLDAADSDPPRLAVVRLDLPRLNPLRLEAARLDPPRLNPPRLKIEIQIFDRKNFKT